MSPPQTPGSSIDLNRILGVGWQNTGDNLRYEDYTPEQRQWHNPPFVLDKPS